jgi:hypothetical protein
MHTKQDATNYHYPTRLQSSESAKDMGDAITKWLSRSDMYSRMTELIKQEEQ